MIVSNCDFRGSERMKPSGGFGHACATSVEDLEEKLRVFGMDCVDDFFPPFGMLLSIKTSGTWKALTPLTP